MAKKVKCIDDTGSCGNLTIGQAYEVEEECIHNGEPAYRLVGISIPRWARRFEVVEEGKDNQESAKPPIVWSGYGTDTFRTAIRLRQIQWNKTMKKVKCIDDSDSGGMLVEGQIYEVVEEKDSCDGKPGYVLKGVGGDLIALWQSRFEEVVEETAAESVEPSPPVVEETIPTTPSFDFAKYNGIRR